MKNTQHDKTNNVTTFNKSYLNVLIATGVLLSGFVISTSALAEEEVLADMSDPLAVFTQAGVGYTDKGLNFKGGKSYDTSNESSMGMNLVEIKGVFGDTLGLRSKATDGIDSVRYRNFTVDMANDRGSQIDVEYQFNNDIGSASYSFIQALPKIGPVSLFPLAGVGVSIAHDMQYDQDSDEVDSGLSIPGMYALIGLYSKIDITDKVWINYNPIWTTPITGADIYRDAGNSFLHEASVSYQINPRMNVRYFANWNKDISLTDGDHRVEVNYQF